MSRYKYKPDPVQRPDTTFGWMTPAIRRAFHKLTRRVSNTFYPSPLDYNELERTCVEAEHRRMIREVSNLIGMNNTRQSFMLDVPMEVNSNRYSVTAQFSFEPGERGTIRWPAYALEAVMLKRSEHDWYHRFAADVRVWVEAVSRIKIAEYTFRVINATKMQQKQVRYLMPGICTLLRMAENEVWDVPSNQLPANKCEQVQQALRNAAKNLSDADAKSWVATPQTTFDFRKALALTNEVIASTALLEDTNGFASTPEGFIRAGVEYSNIKYYKVPELEDAFVNNF